MLALALLLECRSHFDILHAVYLRSSIVLVLTLAAAWLGFRGDLPKVWPESKQPVRRSVKAWERLDGCELIAREWNDGDSFRVRCRGREHLFRLYFVDAPESRNSFPDRVAEQATYFGISPSQALKIGKDASVFTRRQLSGKKFTVWTRWRDALGRSRQPRYYAIVESRGRDLNTSLVSAGLARIYGTRVTPPDGGDSRTYLANLRRLERVAQRERQGAWGISGRRQK